MSANMKCDISPDLTENQAPTGTHTITITDGFETQLERNDEIVFQIARGLVTPISTETTDSFVIKIFDSQGYLINFIEEALTVTML